MINDETININHFHSSGYGIEKTILDCIDGPPAIINYLCEVSRIHTIFIGPDHLVEDAENLPDCIHLLLTRELLCSCFLF